MTLESPLDCKEIQSVHPKGDQSWVFIGRTDVEAETSRGVLRAELSNRDRRQGRGKLSLQGPGRYGTSAGQNLWWPCVTQGRVPGSSTTRPGFARERAPPPDVTWEEGRRSASLCRTCYRKPHGRRARSKRPRPDPTGRLSPGPTCVPCTRGPSGTLGTELAQGPATKGCCILEWLA